MEKKGMAQTTTDTAFMTKKCHNCLTSMPVAARRCPECKKKVGEVDKLGFAKKPVQWVAYITTLIWFQAFCFFVWWAFLKS